MMSAYFSISNSCFCRLECDILHNRVVLVLLKGGNDMKNKINSMLLAILVMSGFYASEVHGVPNDFLLLQLDAQRLSLSLFNIVNTPCEVAGQAFDNFSIRSKPTDASSKYLNVLKEQREILIQNFANFPFQLTDEEEGRYRQIKDLFDTQIANLPTI